MADFIISPSVLKGDIVIPSSKSHTLRAILFAALANGVSTIEKVLASPDTEAMIQAVQQLGAKISRTERGLTIIGVSGKPRVADDVIQCGNSGQVLRFIGAIGALIPEYTILTGDHSIRHNRPVQPLLHGLQQLGATAFSSRGDGFAPILIKGPITQNHASIDGEDSQPVSGLLIASAFAPHSIDLHITNPGEKPWVALTLDWFRRLGIAYTSSDFTYYHLKGQSTLEPFDYSVPGDFSSAAFPIVSALITNSELRVNNLDMTDIQGDKAVIPILQQMGAKISIDADTRSLIVHKGSDLQGIRIDINQCVDALPILSVLGCFAKGKTEIYNGAIARKKESDRICAMTRELTKMGAHIEEKEDGLTIYSSILHGSHLNTYYDHRMALSLSVAALAAKGDSVIRGIECINKTYFSFYPDFIAIGAKIRS